MAGGWVLPQAELRGWQELLFLPGVPSPVPSQLAPAEMNEFADVSELLRVVKSKPVCEELQKDLMVSVMKQKIKQPHWSPGNEAPNELHSWHHHEQDSAPAPRTARV